MVKAIAATVVIPTQDHGPTLRYAVQGALAQTVEDLEILVVGDGAPDVTRPAELHGLLAASEAERERLAAWALQLERDLLARRQG